MRREAAAYLLDANIISAIRASRLSAPEWVGATDLAVSSVVVDELFVDLPEDDPKFIANADLLARLPEPLPTDDHVVDLAERLVERYGRHEPALAPNDALIAAAAILSGRVLVTRNTRDFHYIEGLTMVDASAFDPHHGPLLQFRAPVECRPSERPCCRALG